MISKAKVPLLHALDLIAKDNESQIGYIYNIINQGKNTIKESKMQVPSLLIGKLLTVGHQNVVVVAVVITITITAVTIVSIIFYVQVM